MCRAFIDLFCLDSFSVVFCPNIYKQGLYIVMSRSLKTSHSIGSPRQHVYLHYYEATRRIIECKQIITVLQCNARHCVCIYSVKHLRLRQTHFEHTSIFVDVQIRCEIYTEKPYCILFFISHAVGIFLKFNICILPTHLSICVPLHLRLII